MTVFRSQRADHDIEEIAVYITQDNPYAAIRWIDALEKKINALGDMPSIGSLRSDIKADLRSWAFGNYLILYREVESGVEILRILHGARQWEDLL
jgi:toxin ParE1/3/4